MAVRVAWSIVFMHKAEPTTANRKDPAESAAARSYEFRPMSHADLPLIKRWLEAPHVSEWWHDPSDQFELVSGDLDHPNVAQFIIYASDRPFA